MVIEACIPLVTAIEQRVPLSPAVRDAFLAIDRGVFVQNHYEYEGRIRVRHSAKTKVYTDDALITKIDEVGMPSSSSSKPSVMALMIEALEIQPGHHILEVGAGTGYNAALIRYLVGNEGQVVSVDLDEELVQQARMHLQIAGWDDIYLVAANGFAGYISQSPYDRIMATGAFRHIPHSWQEQLVCGGVFVGNLLGSLASVLVRLVKQDDGTLQGNLLPDGGFFMELRETLIGKRHLAFDWSPYEKVPAEPYTGSLDLTRILHHQPFLFYLQGKRPSLHFQLRPYEGSHDLIARWLIDPDQQSSIVFPFDASDSVKCERRGNLYADVLALYAEWEHLGSPSLPVYHIAMTMAGDLFAEIGSERWQIIARRERTR